MTMINSNRGRERVEFQTSGDSRQLVTAMRLVQEAAEYDAQAFDVSISGLEGFAEFLPSILNDAVIWLQMRHETCKTWTHLGRSLTYRLGTRSDVITSVHQPALSIEFKSLILAVNFVMVIDDSCLRQFIDAMACPSVIAGNTSPDSHLQSPLG